MSESWDYICKSHDPPIKSDLDINHGDDLLEVLFILERGVGWPLEPDIHYSIDQWNPAPVKYRGYDSAEPIRWLRSHPNCKIGLINEYGAEKDIHEKWSLDGILNIMQDRIFAAQGLIRLVEFAKNSPKPQSSTEE